MDASTHEYDDGDAGKAPLPRPGEVVAGKYVLQQFLGEGGMGVVFEALHLKLQRRVALKFVRPDVLAMPDAVARFEREARASSRIGGPNVARVLDVDVSEAGVPFMVMDLLRGRDLEVELKRRKRIPLPEAIDYMLQACAALSEAHGVGVVHRDLKPSNLFLAEENGRRVVKVLDFGISKITSDNNNGGATTTFVTLGTPLYMSPEQVRSATDIDGRSDIWSLAVILYELVAGAPPFLGTTTAAIAAIVADATPSIRQVLPELPEELDEVLATALAKHPSERFPNIEAFAAALLPFANTEVAPAFRPSVEAFLVARDSMAQLRGRPRASAIPLLGLPPPSQKPRGHALRARRRRIAAVAGMLALMVGVGSAAATMAAARGAKPPPEKAASVPEPTPPPVVGVETASIVPQLDAPPLLSVDTDARSPQRKRLRAPSLPDAASSPSAPATSSSSSQAEPSRAHANEHPLYL